MKLGIDLTSLSDRFGGMQYYARSLSEAIIRQFSGEISLYLPGLGDVDDHLNDEHVEAVEVPFPDGSRVVAEQLFLPALTGFGAVDRLLVPAYLGPVMSPVPVDFIVYDFLYLDQRSGLSAKQRMYWKLFYRRTFHQAENLFPISHTVGREIHDHFPGLGHKVGPVLYPGQPRRKPIVQLTSGQQENTRPPYILFVGNISPRKNVGKLIEWYKQYSGKGAGEFDLRLVGGLGWGGFDRSTLHQPESGI
ncbi:MAG: hypothetical protein ABEJ65_09505, partial [bacterium]